MNHILYGALLAGVLNIKHTYRGAIFGATLGSFVAIRRI